MPANMGETTINKHTNINDGHATSFFLLPISWQRVSNGERTRITTSLVHKQQYLISHGPSFSSKPCFSDTQRSSMDKNHVQSFSTRDQSRIEWYRFVLDRRVKTTPQKTRFRSVKLYKEFAYRSKLSKWLQ